MNCSQRSLLKLCWKTAESPCFTMYPVWFEKLICVVKLAKSMTTWLGEVELIPLSTILLRLWRLFDCWYFWTKFVTSASVAKFFISAKSAGFSVIAFIVSTCSRASAERWLLLSLIVLTTCQSTLKLYVEFAWRTLGDSIVNTDACWFGVNPVSWYKI